MRKYIVCVLGLVMVLGFVGMSSAAIVTDPTGDKITGAKGSGPTDITGAQAEQLAPITGVDVLKVSYTATPNIGGIMIFEADVDDSTGTGGSLSMTGIPVAPLNDPAQAKTVPGIDVAIILANRDQRGSGNTGVCTGLPAARTRRFGEWFSVTAGLGGSDTIGALRGFTDPQPAFSQTTKSVTFPWATILVYAKSEAIYAGEGFVYSDALNPATTKWQLSIWTDTDSDYAIDHDDFGDGLTYFDICDVVPNGDGVLAPSVDAGTNLTFCEGNFDFDNDVDGGDASKFKTDFGRSGLKNPCPQANYFY
jgi:hypothetical protein